MVQQENELPKRSGVVAKSKMFDSHQTSAILLARLVFLLLIVAPFMNTDCCVGSSLQTKMFSVALVSTAKRKEPNQCGNVR